MGNTIPTSFSLNNGVFCNKNSCYCIGHKKSTGIQIKPQFQCKCFNPRSDAKVKKIKILRNKKVLWQWTQRHSLSILIAPISEQLTELIPIELVDIIKSFCINDPNCYTFKQQICTEYSYIANVESLIYNKSLCSMWYNKKIARNTDTIWTLKIIFLGTDKATNFIEQFESDRPELQPSYLQKYEKRQSININDKSILLDIENRTNHKCNYHDLYNIDLTSICILAFKSIEELIKIEKICETMFYLNGNIQNCILLGINNNKNININEEKIKLFSKSWNVPYIDNMKHTANEFFSFCVKHFWFINVCSNP